ncbi:MAG: MBL fold metallo-hydrolase [Deltaproteobacteria bacterium]|nr:MBL fold metallo-hydrolase [Deltaproteobacteria bacterium]MBW2595036.1 MBL fold metallo-hydrolase [Deltaproteobacteria bacterium]MBW2649970.1 MBL fold metallo-hydrolase [Deltaproteobacteria bacterium]
MDRKHKQLMEENIKVAFWGVRGTLPVPGRKTVRYGGNTSCVSIEFPKDNFFIFDAGTGIKELSNYLISENRAPIKATIFISHPHWDHINGIPFFAPLYANGNKFEICGPSNGDMSMRGLISGQMDGVYFPINIKEFGATVSFHNLEEERFAIDTVEIQTMFLNHPGQCLGYRLNYRNRSICYVTDNEIYPESNRLYSESYVNKLADFIANTDVLITDCTYTDEEYEEKIGWGHSSVSQVVELADRAKVKNLYLFHHDPDQTDDDIDNKLKMAQAILERKGSSTVCNAPKEGESFDV